MSEVVPGRRRPGLQVVVVNWNTGDELRRCLQSIASARDASFSVEHVVVVDNASTDGSAEDLDDGTLPLTVVRNGANLGFAAACNQGARTAHAPYLLFLNPDTRLHADSLSVPLAYLEDPSHGHVGICGIRLLDDQGRPATSGARYPSLRIFVGQATGLARWFPTVFPRHLLDADECAARGVVDQVIGAYFLMRRSLFDQLGGFDERFFVYFEEVDLSLRAAQRGFVSQCLGTVSATHLGGHSSNQVRALRLFYSLRSRLLYAGKHFDTSSRLALVALTFLIEFPARLVRALLTGGLRDARETGTAYLLLLRHGWRAPAAEAAR